MALQYNPRLDGLRCFAVLAVVLFHWHALRVGWIGVQVFFVLSGYLITEILLRDKERFERKKFLARFYWRRCLRIFPLYFAYLAALGLAFIIAHVPETLPRVLPTLLTYTLNFQLAFATNLPPTTSYSHLWSLAIEEQFYLVWPFLVYWLSPRAFKRCLLAIIVSVPLLRLVLGLFLKKFVDADDWFVAHAIYLLTTSHLDAFALGACIAAGFPIFKINTGSTLSIAFGLLVAFGVIVDLTERHTGNTYPSLGYPVALPDLYQYVWGYCVLNFFSAALIAYLAAPSLPGKIFEFAIVVFIGRISYGIYVIHKSIQFIAWSIWSPPNGSLGDWSLLLLTTTIAIGAAALSYRWLESPFLRMKKSAPFGRRNLASNG